MMMMMMMMMMMTIVHVVVESMNKTYEGGERWGSWFMTKKILSNVDCVVWWYR